MEKAIIIVSGGMDSVTLLHDMNRKYDIVGALSFNYGQRHKLELEMAKYNAEKLGIEHQIIDLTSLKPILKGSSLTDNIEVPEGHYQEENMKSTVVPNRNMIMLSIATAYAISKNANLVFYGAHSGDHEIYPDCRPEFIDKLSEAIKICDYNPIYLKAPYSHTDKAGILSIGIPLGVDYSKTLTCYNGRQKACGKCGSCCERALAFLALGLKDPVEYEEGWDKVVERVKSLDKKD